jgi:uncharacterized protein
MRPGASRSTWVFRPADLPPPARKQSSVSGAGAPQANKSTPDDVTLLWGKIRENQGRHNMNYHAAKAFILDKLSAELSDKLTYHGIHHTLDVLYMAEDLCYAEKISPYQTLLVKTASLYHDAGFTIGTQEHESLGCEIVRAYLPRYDYTAAEIDSICGMIMATRIPQTPKNILEEIICDADLDYLGRDDFPQIGDTLFAELKAYNVLRSVKDWNRLQVNFLENHRFFTRTNRARRNPQKQRHLEELKKVVASYENF